MDAAKNIWVILLLLVTLYTDVKSGKIYNMMTFPSMVFGIFVSMLGGGADGLKWSLLGWLMPFVIFFLPYMLGGLKAGDIKLLCAVGCIKGPYFAFYSSMATALTGGLVAALFLLKRKALVHEATTMGQRLLQFALYKIPMRLDDAQPSKFPYGVAIAAGTLAVLWKEKFLAGVITLH